jgi:hypothetical protein
MSKRVAVSVVALLLAAVAHTGFAQDLGVGGRIGPTFTTFGGDADRDSKTGFIVGGFFIYSFSELVSVYPELSYVRKGASSTRLASGGFDPSTGGFLEHTLEHTTDLDYLELQVPITLTIPAHRIGVRVYGGPAVALELKCSAEQRLETEAFSPAGTSLGVDSATVSGGCEDESLLHGVPLFTSTKSLDFGLVFGAGIDVGIGKGAITGDFRFDLGLSDIQDGTDGSIKNRAFEILLGYAHYFSG